MSVRNDIAIQKTIEDYCAARDQAIQNYKTALRCLESAKSCLNPMGSHAFPPDGNLQLSIGRFTREVDERMWEVAFDKTGLLQFMDAKATREFRYSIKHKTPPFTLEVVRQQLTSAASRADEYFARGVVELFRSLSDDYKTNSKEVFCVGPKAVMTYMTSRYTGSMEVSYRARPEINDLDRVFQTLAGFKYQPGSLESAINTAWKDPDNRNVFENDFFHMRGFKNGNLHIKFKRQDLLDKANRLIADWYGAALARDAA